MLCVNSLRTCLFLRCDNDIGLVFLKTGALLCTPPSLSPPSLWSVNTFFLLPQSLSLFLPPPRLILPLPRNKASLAWLAKPDKLHQACLSTVTPLCAPHLYPLTRIYPQNFLCFSSTVHLCFPVPAIPNVLPAPSVSPGLKVPDF